MKKYELTYRMYIPVKVGNTRSYGGNQLWFSRNLKEIKDLEAYTMNRFGCGIIAICDLMIYLRMTLPNGKKAGIGEVFDNEGRIDQERYMSFVREMKRKYVRFLSPCGTFGWQLSYIINDYLRSYDLGLKASIYPIISPLKTLKEIEASLKLNRPVILMIGQSFPVALSNIRKVGIPFFKRTKITGLAGSQQKVAYATYEIVEQKVYGHFVMITGIVTDEQANWASQKIMLKISSWGEEYYISYDHYLQYVRRLSKPWLCGMITVK